MGGKVMHAHFRLAGRDYYAMDAGPQFPFTEAISLFVSCADQAEVDRYWDALTADGGQEQPCGWLKDRWGLSWQIVPDRLIELIRDPDPDRSHRAVQAMLQMTQDRHRRDRGGRRRGRETAPRRARDRSRSAHRCGHGHRR